MKRSHAPRRFPLEWAGPVVAHPRRPFGLARAARSPPRRPDDPGEPMTRTPVPALALLIAVAAWSPSGTARAQDSATHPSDLMRLNQAASDTALAKDVIPEIRSQLATAP